MPLYTWKNLDIFTPIFPCDKRGENVRIVRCAETTYWSNKTWQLYVVTYYKVTQLCREYFCLSCIILEKTWENDALYDINDIYMQSHVDDLSMNNTRWLTWHCDIFEVHLTKGETRCPGGVSDPVWQRCAIKDILTSRKNLPTYSSVLNSSNKRPS